MILSVAAAAATAAATAATAAATAAAAAAAAASELEHSVDQFREAYYILHNNYVCALLSVKYVSCVMLSNVHYG